MYFLIILGGGGLLYVDYFFTATFKKRLLFGTCKRRTLNRRFLYFVIKVFYMSCIAFTMPVNHRRGGVLQFCAAKLQLFFDICKFICDFLIIEEHVISLYQMS